MVIIYGSRLCPDCVAVEKAFAEKGQAYEYRDITENLSYLKEFLAIRDGSPLFDAARAHKGIGIPCIVDEAGQLELDAEQFLAKSFSQAGACSLDGRGC